MKKFAIVLAVASGLAAPVAADHKHHHHGHHGDDISRFQGGTIIVSCFRGPWNDVIWDRPNSKFVDSLVAIGYDFPTAHAVAERVCRDDRLVNNPEGLKSEMRRIYYDARSRKTLGH
ncbi:hypothetical protein [Roseivivax isoporae]|uniref:Uncharacterized protein n=1 Tax=Roseivivax isoporae LMG 25204 TaxID=1449351 RepID=X7F8P4_9RHOB|nr:hypothetical protein [Roseivivax isoporae]ETX28454.1 hypothetical protein RISW2_06750 [Roseivivax isoporae LMG 25204]